VSFGGEMGRWRYLHDKWKREKARGSEALEPVIPDIEDQMSDAAEYSVKYTTKVELPKDTSTMPDLATLITRKAPQTPRSLSQSPSTPSILLQPGTLQTPPSERGRLFVTRGLNALNSSTTYAATTASHIVLGYGDSITSHTSTVHDHEIFATYYHTAGQESHDYQQNTTVDLSQDPQGHPRFSTALDDYLARDRDIEYLCPFFLTMLYEKKPIDNYGKMLLEGTYQESPRHQLQQRLFFNADHHQHQTHMLLRLSQPRLCRLIRNIPCRPTSDAPEKDKISYAVFVLGNFSSYRKITPMPEDLWATYLDWQHTATTSSLGQCAVQILDNMDSQARTRDRHTKAGKLRRREAHT